MRYKCYIETEKRGVLSADERKRYRSIIQSVFKAVMVGDASNAVPVCAHHAVPGIELNVILTDDDGIQIYNRQYRDLDKSTDVLSFPVSDFAPGQVTVDCDNINPENGYLSLGDMILSVERMKAQAVEFGHGETRELAFLTCHSILHLLGYDHETESEAHIMESACEAVLDRIGFTRDCED